jgi:hypothetical protein
MRILRPALKQLSHAGGHADARVAGPQRGMMAFGTYLFIVGGIRDQPVEWATATNYFT